MFVFSDEPFFAKFISLLYIFPYHVIQGQDMSEDAFNHQSAITHLQTLEEEVLDAHRQVFKNKGSVTFMGYFLRITAKMNGTKNEINCDL